jgi:hypothetical protein
MTKTIENLFIYSATYTALLPIIFFFAFSVTRNRIFQILVTYSSIEFATNITSLYLPDSKIVIIYAIFTIAEYLLLASIFYLLIHNILFKKIIKFSCFGFLFFSVIYPLVVHYNVLDTLPIGIETLLILSFSFYFLYEQMDEQSQILIYQRYSFWIVAAIMLYLGGSFFIYIFANQVDEQTRHLYWVFQNAFTVLKNILFFISIFCFKKEIKSLSIRNKYYNSTF